MGINNKKTEIREVFGGILLQEKDLSLYDSLDVVTDRKPSDKELEDLIFAYKVVKCTKSNSVCIVKDKRTLGVGLGDVNRFFASSHALDMAKDDAKGAVVASDGFFLLQILLKPSMKKALRLLFNQADQLKIKTLLTMQISMK